MWKDKVIEAKKKQNISAKAIAAKTNGQLSERQVVRLLNGEAKTPFVDDVLAVGAAVGLSARELFEDANAVLDATGIVDEVAELKKSNAVLEAENEMLKREVAHMEQLIALKDELLGLYRETRKPNMLTLSTF
jgi:transcriptional regulator with XRE-family HTH domain